MMKNAKRFLSMLLAVSMVFGLLVMPTSATENHTHEHTNEANTVSTKNEIKVEDITVPFTLNTDDVEVDHEDPAIIALENDLGKILVLNAEGEAVPLTEAEKQQIVAMFQQYLDHWAANANLLGVQVPFFLQYNDNEDELGILGEMLAMANIPLAAVRAGQVPAGDLTGMIQNFLYGDALGVQLYGRQINAARDEVLNLIKNSGAQTEVQKLLILNDWLAHNVTFDMPYIMNTDKEEGEKPMVAADPQPHEHYQTVYDVIYSDYEEQLKATFEQNIRDGLKAEMKKSFYKAAIEQGYYDGVYAQVEAQVAQSIYDQAYEATYQDAYDAAYAEYMEANAPTEPTEPEATEPEATEPEATEPEATEPEATEPEATEPEATEPEATEPEATEPEATEPEATEPEATEPEATEPEATEPEATEPEATEPEATEPEVTEPVEGEENAPTVNEEGDEPTLEELADAYATEKATAAADEAGNAAVEANKATIEEQATAAAESETEKFMTENAEAIDADPVAFCETAFGADAAAEIAAGWDYTWADWEANGIPGMVAMFSGEIWKAVIEQFYIQGMTQQGMTEEQAAAQAAQIMEADADAIAADPYGYCVEKFGEDGAKQAESVVNDQLKQMGIDGSKETNPEGRVHMDVIVALQMDTPQQDPMLQKPDGSYMTPNEAIPVFADQAAAGLTDGVLNYWQGSHFGALGRGTAVCLGYTKAFTYLVQYMHPEVYGKTANADMSKSENWKAKEDLYYTDGALDITKNYVVDDVRITFDASVTMYGETQDNFNSDHFWNAVQIDGKWYYVDPCYTDVYTEVMMRDRVETDGSMNHLYFMFSHSTAAELYDGNYKEIKTLYDGVATHTDYEDSWISRIKSNTYFDGGYAYYLYDSTDLISLMQEANSDNMNSSDLMNQEYLYKIVRHKLDTTDAGDDGDTDYETLIEFNYKADEDDEESIARVYNGTKMVESVKLTKLFAQFEAEKEIYPSLALTAALYNGKIYFNISNAIASYDLSTYEVEIVKEYNTVYGLRDDTNPFGGMAFTVSDESNYDFVVENHPIAGMTIKEDGNMYVSIATNFAFISGKDPHNSEDQSSYGYEFQESNYNAAYNSYATEDYDSSMMEQFGYEEETNDNDEFMWSANFVETLSMSHLAGTRHSYKEVSVAATCGRNAYTENRCTTCGASEPDTRVEVADSAIAAHHYVEFEETYYTKGDNGNWNTGRVYVCTVCGFHIEEPTEPDPDADYSMMDTTYEEQKAIYDEQKAIYDDAVATAGHTYEATDAVWAEDNSTVTFSILECSSVCPEKQPYLDCLLLDDTIKLTLEEKVVAESYIAGTTGTCPEGVIITYAASGEVEVEIIEDKPETFEYFFTIDVQQEKAECDFSTGICPICGDSNVKRIYGNGRVETALEAVEALKAVLEVETFNAIIIANGDNFADALAGSYLATVKDAPILLHRNSGAGDELNQEYILANLAEGGIVYALGGTAAIPEELVTALTEAGVKVKRLAGDSRFLTNLAILEEAGIGNEEILITTGWNFADCLSASATGKPILMLNTVKNELTAEQVEFLTKYAANNYTIVGGNAAVSDELAAAIDEIVTGEIVRLSGSSREETSVMVAERFFKAPEFAVLAYSRNFPDGLCGGPLAYAMNAPLLLTNTGMEDVTAAYIAENEIEAGYIMGGIAAVAEDTAKVCFGITSELEIPKL